MVEEDRFGNGNILAVPSEFYFAASFLFKKKNTCFQGICNLVK